MTDKQDGNEVTYHTQGTPISEYDEIKILDDSGKKCSKVNMASFTSEAPIQYITMNMRHT